jgi:choline-phosphate cytidylyltransferase
VSWLKKNELDLKRHAQELRDNIRTNWSTTGQELSKELRQYWPASRPQSPARAAFLSPNGGPGVETGSPVGLVPSSGFPRSPSVGGERTGNNVNDFITGYTLGLIGGVRSWVCIPHLLFQLHQRLMGRADDKPERPSRRRRQSRAQRRRLGRGQGQQQP